MTPNGEKLGVLKAVISTVLSLVTLFPLRSLFAKKTKTSGILKCPATSREPSRLSTASFLSSRRGIYDPVMITVLFRFSSINERADAV
jgi:hypothetical protein